MKLVSRLLCGLVLAALPCTAALADTVSFNFSFGAPNDPIYGSGVLTAQTDGTHNGTPLYLVTGITGVTAGKTITGIAAPGTFPIGFGYGSGNDNLLSDPASFPGGDGNGGVAYFDTNGLSYELSNGDFVNLAENDDQSKGYNVDYYIFTQSYVTQTSDNTISVSPVSSPVPEPESLALFGTGLLGVVGLVRRRFVS